MDEQGRRGRSPLAGLGWMNQALPTRGDLARGPGPGPDRAQIRIRLRRDPPGPTGSGSPVEACRCGPRCLDGCWRARRPHRFTAGSRVEAVVRTRHASSITGSGINRRGGRKSGTPASRLDRKPHSPSSRRGEAAALRIVQPTDL